VVTTEPSLQALDETSRPASGATRAGPPRRTRRPVAALIALVFFFGPAGAYAFGVRPAAFENRALADLPSPSDGWSFFPDFTTWAVDHLPLRQQAVRAYTAGSERVFGEPPSYGGTEQGPLGGVPTGESTDDEGTEYPQVLQGQDGWLYFGSDVRSMCEPARTVDDTVERLGRLAEAVESSGRRFVFTVAPDKTTIYPDALPDTYLGEECAAERRTAFWDALRSEAPEWYADLRVPLEEEQERTGPLYRPSDTHWAPRGAAVYAEELARALDPRLLDDFEVVENGTVDEPGDLARMLGTRVEDEVPAVSVVRPGVEPVGRDTLELPGVPTGQPVTARNESSDALLFPGRTLLLGDSFTNASLKPLGGLFAEVTLLHNEVAGPYPQAVADMIVDSDVVVLEIVERTIGGGGGAMISDAALDAIEDTLAQHPR
jgi:hypothetical protein